MTFYNNAFDVSIQCEEQMEVSPEEQAEVFQMMADEHSEDYAGYAEWSANLEQESEKDWLNGYKPITEGKTYNGLDV